MKPTHRHCKPVQQSGGWRYEVRIRDPLLHKVIYCGTYDTIAKCVTALRAALPRRASEFTEKKLRLSNKTAQVSKLQAVKRKYASITYDKTRLQKPWRIQSSKGGGYFDDQDEAAVVLARRQKISVNELRLEKPRWLMQSFARQQKDFQQGMLIYHKRYPGDVEYIDKVAARSSQCARAFQAYPGVIASFFIAKFDDHRNDLLSACDETRARLRATKEKKDPVETLYEILVVACRKASKHPWTAAFINNVGKTNYHWMVFWIYMVKLKVLADGKPSVVDRRGLIFTASKKKYYIQLLDSEVKKRLQSQVAFGEGCMSQASKVPRTLLEYEICFNAIDKGIPPVFGAQNKKKYMRKWLKRGFLRWLLQKNKVTLKIGDMTVRQMVNMWPDEHGRLLPLLSQAHLSRNQNLASKAVDALRRLNYKDDPDMISAQMCNLDHKSVQKVLRSKRADWIQRHKDALIRMREAFKANKKHKIYPHPGTLFSKAARTLD